MSKMICGHEAGHLLARATIEGELERAAARTVEHGQRWTPPRHRVYELLLEANAPIKAYDLIERFGGERTTKPPTVYRALEFLEHSGLIHRIASLNAYIACGLDVQGHAAAFLICDCCGVAEEFEPDRVTSAERAAAAAHFHARAISLEVRGRCKSCGADPR